MRSFLRTSLTLTFILAATASAWAVQPFMPRYPAINPDGSTVVFSFQGDLWSVDSNGGQALRLTAHPAYDAYPVFNSDGSKLAFSSDRYGDRDVFLMDARGGAPVRLTFAATSDIPQTFSLDGSTLYFSAVRIFQFPMDNQINRVPVTGGTPFRAFDFFADEASILPDGSFVLGIGRNKIGRRLYRGTYQRDIYTYTPGGEPTVVSNHPGFEARPLAGPNGRIFWISDDNESMTDNLWVMNSDGSGKTQLTSFVGEDVRWASIAAEGFRFVLEAGTDLYLLENRPGAEPLKLQIDVAADLIENPVVIEDLSGDADELAVTSDGAEFAMLLNGELVLVNKELGGRATVAVPSPARDQAVNFRPDIATELLFVSDRNGQPQILKLVVKDDAETLREAKEFEITEMTGRETPAYGPLWSPDGKRFLYTLGNGDLHLMDAKGKSDKTLMKRWRQRWHPLDYSWSPDGQWVALSVEDEDYNTDIWIVKADGSGQPVNITQHPKYDTGPVWSGNGSMLAWSSNRSSRQTDVYFVYLTRADDERTREEWEIWEKTRDAAKKDEKDDKKKDKPEPVAIDFEDIHFRARRISTLPGQEQITAIHPKGDKFFFTTSIDGDNDLYSVNRFGEELTAITSGGTSPGAISLVDGSFYFLASGKPNHVGMDGGSTESTSFTARLTTDRVARRLQAIGEGWQIVRDFFYDAEMHGVDWDAAKEKYLRWSAKVAHDKDFADIVDLMLGELNASHMGYYQPWTGRGSEMDGLLGLEYDPNWQGEGLKVARVIPYGPADHVKNRVLPGDIITQVNGLPVGMTSNIYATLEKRANLPTDVKVLRGKKSLDFEVQPVRWLQINSLLTEQWERDNRKAVELATGGRVGYVYIRGMSWPEVERFEMNLYAAANGKDALIIDVRSNGGGWTTDFMMTILTQPQHAITVGRNGKPGYPQAERQIFYRWEKPIAVICDESSYSNAEIFSHAIKTIGRGPLVGNTTGGNVISTGGWYTMMPNNAWIRLPQRGWYVWGDAAHPERNGLNQEGNGAVPDYLIVRTQSDILNGRDPQLDKAVELMIEAAAEEADRPKPQPR